jgi:glycosyltransferase involved in cell wall biosynthesis
MSIKTYGKHCLIAIPCLLLGGTEIQTLNLCRALILGGYQVKVCCYYEFDEKMVDAFQNKGAEVILMALDRTQGLFHLIWKLKALFKRIKPDIVHVQYMAPGFVPIIAAKLSDIRTVFATSHIAGTIAFGWKAKCLLRLAAMLCTTFFCVSKGVENFWFGNSAFFTTDDLKRRRKHYTIYNPVDIHQISTIVEKTDTDHLKAQLNLPSENLIGIVGRLHQQKGHADLLEAMVSIVKDKPDVRLLIIGDGSLRNTLQKKAEKLGIGDKIVWLDAVSQERVFELYSIIDILVMPSLCEGFGLAAAEAMAAGLPVVASDVDGLCEVVNHEETGYLTLPGSSRLLAERIIKLLSNPAKAADMGQAGRKRATRLFSMERFTETIICAYKELSHK